jgi:2-polyprenyl-6-methoxyphenol hydroxylase-like FAD-dependent oxidoreductase
MMALLLARKGIKVTLLEAQKDFDREFRGDSIQPGVLEIMEELGLIDRFFQLPHSKATRLVLHSEAGIEPLQDYSRLKKYPFLVRVPQTLFLEFITTEAKKYRDFRIVMGARVQALIEEDGVVQGVRYQGDDGWHELRACLTVGADGRVSTLRRLAGFEPIKNKSALDVIGFKLPHLPGDAEIEEKFLLLAHEAFPHLQFVVNDRSEYFQVAIYFPKGEYGKIRAAGVEELRRIIARALPQFARNAESLKDWNQISYLAIESSRLRRWYKPGLLLIGDAAHVFMPFVGVGTTYAIFDAVVAANLLARPLKEGQIRSRDLSNVQRKRALSVWLMQRFQIIVQNRIRKIDRAQQRRKPSLLIKILFGWPLFRDISIRLIAYGWQRVHVEE